MRNHERASEVAVTLSLRYLVLYGSEPSREMVVRWIEELQSLNDDEFDEIGGNEGAQKRFLQRMR